MTKETITNKVKAFPTVKGKSIKAEDLKNDNFQGICEFLDLIKELFPFLPIPECPDKPEEPTEPTDPTDPEEPEEPEEPTEPTDPTDPEEPEEPTDPEEPEEPTDPTDPEKPNVPKEDAIIPLGVSAVGVNKMWSKGYYGKEILIGVIDAGINKHPDLDNNVKIRRNYTSEKEESSIEHGTHVAGIIAANGKIAGVAPLAKLADYRALDSEGAGSYENIVQAIIDATDDGCHIINMSLGGPFNIKELKDAIDYAIGKGTCVIAAVGNEGDGFNFTNEISYPAVYPNVIGVGSINYNNYDKPSRFSNSNPQVDCCSHGEKVLSTGLNGNYIELTGTSMACPHISGVTALIIEEMIKNNKEITPEKVYEKLLSNAIDVYRKGYDNSTGYGFVTFNKKL